MTEQDMFPTPKVTLIDFTGAGRKDERWHAADVLIYTKSTRLNMDPGLFDEIKRWPVERKRKELDVMAQTIRSSWEFVDVTFLIEGVSRACAQQMTRTRHASYAMQSQRVTNVADAKVTNPYAVGDPLHGTFDALARDAVLNYKAMGDAGAELQDARGLLPMNIQCNLVAKYNLRAFVELVIARSSLRTQGEYAEIIGQMRHTVLSMWPWAEGFFEPPHAQAIRMLEDLADHLGVEVGRGPGWTIAKAVDLLRKDQ